VEEQTRQLFARKIPPNTPSIEVEYQKKEDEVSLQIEIADEEHVSPKSTPKRHLEDDQPVLQADLFEGIANIVEVTNVVELSAGNELPLVFDFVDDISEVLAEPPAKRQRADDHDYYDLSEDSFNSPAKSIEDHRTSQWEMVVESVREELEQEKINHAKEVESLNVVISNLRQSIQEEKEKSKVTAAELVDLRQSIQEEKEKSEATADLLAENKTTIKNLTAENVGLKISLQVAKDTLEKAIQEETDYRKHITDSHEKEKKNWKEKEEKYIDKMEDWEKRCNLYYASYQSQVKTNKEMEVSHKEEKNKWESTAAENEKKHLDDQERIAKLAEENASFSKSLKDCQTSLEDTQNLLQKAEQDATKLRQMLKRTHSEKKRLATKFANKKIQFVQVTDCNNDTLRENFDIERENGQKLYQECQQLKQKLNDEVNKPKPSAEELLSQITGLDRRCFEQLLLASAETTTQFIGETVIENYFKKLCESSKTCNPIVDFHYIMEKFGTKNRRGQTIGQITKTDIDAAIQAGFTTFLIPVIFVRHWFLLTVLVPEKEIIVSDSLGERGPGLDYAVSNMENLQQLFPGFVLKRDKYAPIQPAGSNDCGAWTCLNGRRYYKTRTMYTAEERCEIASPRKEILLQLLCKFAFESSEL